MKSLLFVLALGLVGLNGVASDTDPCGVGNCISPCGPHSDGNPCGFSLCLIKVGAVMKSDIAANPNMRSDTKLVAWSNSINAAKTQKDLYKAVGYKGAMKDKRRPRDVFKGELVARKVHPEYVQKWMKVWDKYETKAGKNLKNI